MFIIHTFLHPGVTGPRAAPSRKNRAKIGEDRPPAPVMYIKTRVCVCVVCGVYVYVHTYIYIYICMCISLSLYIYI